MRRLNGANGRDALIAVGVIALCEIQAATGTGLDQVSGPAWLRVASGVMMGAPLVTRRRYPRISLLSVFAAALIASLLGLSTPTQGYIGEMVAALVALYTVAETTELGWAIAGFAYAYGSALLLSLGRGPYNYVGSFLIIGSPVVVARFVRSRRLLVAKLRETADELRLSQDANARAAVAVERAAIARELHDVVAHAVSVMVIQAGAAERMLEGDPQRAGDPIRAVQASGRQALSELRRLLGVLRPDDATTTSVAAAPGIAELERLARQVEDAGLRVDLSTGGVARELPRGVDLACFRIVQEALTNSLKHSHARLARVTVRYDDDAIELEVVDDGRGDTTAVDEPPSKRGGHGIAVMRERAAMYGGEVHTGPATDGGFAVRARLPIGADG